MSDAIVDRDEEVEDRLSDVPQAPGDPGYEPPAIIPELDLAGGTVFKVGEDEYATLEEAQDAITPDEEVPPDEETDLPPEGELTP